MICIYEKLEIKIKIFNRSNFLQATITACVSCSARNAVNILGSFSGTYFMNLYENGKTATLQQGGTWKITWVTE